MTHLYEFGGQGQADLFQGKSELVPPLSNRPRKSTDVPVYYFPPNGVYVSQSHKHLEWAPYFFDMIKVIRTRSKDPNTQVGCVIVGPNMEIRSTGYNSFPRGINDDVPERKERPEKYLWIEHSERNAIFNAARVGIPLDGCILYIQGIPCMDCARAVIQSGIKKIIYDTKEWAKWTSAKYDKTITDKSLQMFEEAGVEVIGYEV